MVIGCWLRAAEESAEGAIEVGSRGVRGRERVGEQALGGSRAVRAVSTSSAEDPPRP